MNNFKENMKENKKKLKDEINKYIDEMKNCFKLISITLDKKNTFSKSRTNLIITIQCIERMDDNE